MKRLSSVLFLLLICSVLCAASYVVDAYGINVDVGKNAVHSVKESIALDYTSQSHGFFRYIPCRYGSVLHALVKDFKCTGDRFELSRENGYVIAKVGDADTLHYGKKDYSLSYLYDMGADRNDGYDEFYFNLLSGDFDSPVGIFTYTVNVPCRASDVKIWVTAGQYGSTDLYDYDITETPNGITVSGGFSGLRRGDAVTIRLQFADGWYEGARQPWDFRHTWKIINYVFSIVAAFLAFAVWKKYGHDRIPVITARFTPPENFSPALVGYLFDGHMGSRDVTSMIFYWADRGLLKIEEKKKGKFSFTKLKNIDDSAEDYEKTLYNGFFRGVPAGETATLEEIRDNGFPETVAKASSFARKYFSGEKRIKDKKSSSLKGLFSFVAVLPLITLFLSHVLYEFSSGLGVLLLIPVVPFILVGLAFFNALFRKWYVRKSNVPMIIVCCIWLLAGIAAFITVYRFESPAYEPVPVVLSVLSSFVIMLFASITDRRSDYGNTVFEQILGYRQFIDMVSMSELSVMIDEDPKLYYHVLSYAIALKLETKWAKKFDSITVPPPDWYSGIDPVGPIFYASMIGRMQGAVAVATSVPETHGGPGVRPFSAGGGFNSGGFAGGGFGGGGMRAW